MSIQLVVFDMAGTTVMDKGNINDAFRQAFLTEDIVVSASDIDKVMGYKKIEAVKVILDQYAPELKEKEKVADDIHEIFVDNMIDFYENDPDLQPLPHAISVFQELRKRGIKVALNTGFTRAIADTILARLGWDELSLLDATICSDEVQEGRPYPFMIQSLMQLFEITDVKNVAKVGDTEVDVKEGRNAGCGLVVAVTTGSYSKEQLQTYSPDFIIDSLQELLPLIQ